MYARYVKMKEQKNAPVLFVIVFAVCFAIAWVVMGVSMAGSGMKLALVMLPFGILVPAFIISAVVKSARKGNSGDAPVNADEVNRVLESSAQTLTGESTEQKQRSYVKCAYCGMQIEEAAAFCTYCGAAKVR